MTGTLLLLRTLWPAQRRRLAVWVAAAVAGMALTALSIAQLYDTPAKVRSYGEAVVSDALVAINGRVEGIDTLGGIIQDEFGFIASFLMPLIGIALVAAMTRAEEESGRLEALLAGRIDRRAPVLATLILVVAAIAVMVLGFTAALLAAGIDLGSAVLYSLALGSVSLVFAALAAVCAQLVLHSRGVHALGFAALGASYLLRGVGDVNDSFWVWLSPLGWLEKTAPFASQRWWVLLVPAAVTLVLAGTAVLLAGRRDLGAAVHRPGPGASAASRLLVRPVGLAARGQAGELVGWLIGSLALAGVMGALAQEVVDAILGNASLTRAMGIDQDTAADGFLALTQVYLALVACGYVVQAVGTLRAEEASGRLEPMLAGSTGRLRWFAARMLVIVAGLVAIVVLSALVFGATTALSTGRSGYLGTLLQAGLAYLPAELVVAAVAAALYGFVPRAFGLAWALFAGVAFIGLLGSGLQLDQWVLDLSPLTHVGNPPAGDVDGSALGWLAAVTVVLGAAAGVGFRRRRVPST
ncbi:ABC transporter permease [Nocardioides sambongensis]|uniref:ABC transporter permease n=1 Tax=Nocardioides sambongensis TaxID=2589074 RepID=UPI0011292396|nr:ABC transporter permease [Nocardioides sambongensis]